LGNRQIEAHVIKNDNPLILARHFENVGRPSFFSAKQRQLEMLTAIGVSTATPESLLATLPFTGDDTTAGSETELQVAVEGSRASVDLPQVIEQSTYFANMMRREKAGETSRKTVSALEQFLYGNPENVWENSWVRLPRGTLSPFAQQVFHSDLRADKENPEGEMRQDAERFFLLRPRFPRFYPHSHQLPPETSPGRCHWQPDRCAAAGL